MTKTSSGRVSPAVHVRLATAGAMVDCVTVSFTVMFNFISTIFFVHIASVNCAISGSAGGLSSVWHQLVT